MYVCKHYESSDFQNLNLSVHDNYQNLPLGIFSCAIIDFIENSTEFAFSYFLKICSGHINED